MTSPRSDSSEVKKQSLESKKSFATKAVSHHEPKVNVRPLVTPIYATSTFLLDSAEEGAKLSDSNQSVLQAGWLYSRWNNPTVEICERTIASLEGGFGALLAGSGMSAIIIALFATLSSGDHMVLPQAVYGGTHEYLSTYAKKLGIEVSFVDATNPMSYERAIRPNTKVFYTESPTNPTLRLTDIGAVAKLAKKQQLVTITDSTFGSPWNQNPISLGADIIVHSATKYLGGHSDIIAGTLITATFELYKACWNARRLLGNVLSPFDSFLLQRGIKTLDVRMQRHNENAMKIAKFLEQHPKVSRVFYPGLESHPDHELAKRQMKRGFGGMLSFELKNGLNAGIKLVETVKVINLAVSLGGAESLIEHPASMTHTMIPKIEREKAGITDGLIRFSVGIEDADDLIADLTQALQ